jgi:hypothetical protein
MTTRQKRLRTITAAFALLALLNGAANAADGLPASSFLDTHNPIEQIAAMDAAFTVYSTVCNVHLPSDVRATLNTAERLFSEAGAYEVAHKAAYTQTVMLGAEYRRLGAEQFCAALSSHVQAGIIGALYFKDKLAELTDMLNRRK